jgi:tellurite resistance protein
MFLVIAADLEVTDTEFAALKGAIRGLTGETLSDDIVEVMMETYARRLADEGRSNRLAALGQAMTDVAEARNTFTLAAAAALADGVLVDEESQVIRELKEVFGLTDSQVAEVLGELTQDGQH